MQTDQGRNHNYQPLNSNIPEDARSQGSLIQKFENLNARSEHSQANQPLIGQVQDQTSIQSQIQIVDPMRQSEDAFSQGDLQPPVQYMGIQEKEQAMEEIKERNKEKLEKEIYQKLKKEFQEKLNEMDGKLKQVEKKKKQQQIEKKKNFSNAQKSYSLKLKYQGQCKSRRSQEKYFETKAATSMFIRNLKVSILTIKVTNRILKISNNLTFKVLKWSLIVVNLCIHKTKKVNRIQIEIKQFLQKYFFPFFLFHIFHKKIKQIITMAFN